MSLKVTAQLGNDTRDIKSRGMDIHQLKQRIDASGKETSTNHRPVRFDYSGVGSYQNEVREGSEDLLTT